MATNSQPSNAAHVSLQSVRSGGGCVFVEQGSKVGVVLLNLGGPSSLEETEAFVERVYADLNEAMPQGMTPWGRWKASRDRHKVTSHLKAAYEAIGGRSPLNRDMRAMARALQRALRRTEWAELGVNFKAYEALRYGTPSIEETVRQMQLDEVDEVVLATLCPRMGDQQNRVGIRHWRSLEAKDQAGPWQAVLAEDYITDASYVEAVNNRINEALGRFPRHVRSDVTLVFAAHAQTKQSVAAIETVRQRIMQQRTDARTSVLAIQRKRRPTSWIADGAAKTLKKCAKDGETSVLVVPLTFVTDHIETLYGLDVQVRQQSAAWGIEHLEVTTGLNNHSMFIRALRASVLKCVQMRQAERNRVKREQYAQAG